MTHISAIIKVAFSALMADVSMAQKLSDAYVVVPCDLIDDFRRVARSRGLDFVYSVEAADEGIEYHVHSELEDARSILWAIRLYRREMEVVRWRG